LRKGARLTKPVNLDGYWSARSFFTLGLPLNFMKSSLNWNAGVSYSRIPGLIDNVENLSNNYNYNVGAVIASNISEYIDFTVSYSANFNVVKNSIQPELNNNYFNHVASFQLNLLSKSGWLFQNDLNNQLYRGLTEEFNQDYWLWNMAVGKKFLKDQKGELKLSVFDLLKQNQAISRTATETYIEDVQNDVLQHFMLTFTYKLRNFGSRNR
jgi:predicted GIY-YIG superfamily endonuclease